MEMKSIEFETLKGAVEYAKAEGGWIFAGEKTTWFNARFYTPTIILNDVKGSGQLGTWGTFEN